MKKLIAGLTLANLIGAVLYLVVCGGAMLSGHPIYPGQGGLMAQVASGILLTLAPALIERIGHFTFPPVLKVIYLAFILASVLLGTGMQFYDLIPYWDKFLHLFSAGMLAGLGLAIFGALTPKEQLTRTKPLLLALFAVAFGTTLGVFWEFYEFTFDGLLGLNMQRFAENGVGLVGRAALMDTMGDLFADVFGAILLGAWAFFGIRRNPAWLDTFMFERR